MEPDKISMFPLFIGAMIHEVLEANGISSSIKWPNDIYLAGRKLAGILCESVIKDGRVEKLIIGFGININQTPEELIEGNMTSLYNYTGREFNRRELLAEILTSIFSRVKDPIEDKMAFAERIVGENLYLKGEEVEFLADRLYRGTLLGINNKGEIILLTENGSKEFLSGKILIEKI